MKTPFAFFCTTRFHVHTLRLVCVVFASFSIYFAAVAQCTSGLSITMSSDLFSNRTAIPFGTPINVTTVVSNAGGSAQTVNLQTAYTIPRYDVFCAGNYSWNGSIAQRTITVQPGSSVSSTITLVYNVAIAGQSIAFREVQSSFSLNGVTCSEILDIQPPNGEAQPLGTPGQTTTVNVAPNVISLIIRGNVILNADFTAEPLGVSPGVTFPYIYMDEGATLTIPSGRTLQLKGAKVFGIRSMWNSIIVQSGGTLLTASSYGVKTTIKDGMRAIDARDGSNINVSFTNFEDNIRSLYVPPSSGALQSINFGSAFIACDFNGTGQLRPTPTATLNCNTNKIVGYPFAGMDINDLGSLLTVSGAVFNTPRPSFRNMSVGIVARRARLFVNRAKFENIKSTYSNYDGLGIWIRDPNSSLLVAGEPNSSILDFNNCSQGIIYENFGLNDLAQINVIRMDNTASDIGAGVGIRAINNNNNQSYIYANNIRAKTGIISLYNRFNAAGSVGEINNNIIESTNPADLGNSIGIVGYENSATGNWNIYGNTINVQSSLSGMLFYSGNGARLTNNNILMNPTSHVNACGIDVQGSSNFNVSCNDISGSGIANSTYRSGLIIRSGTGSSYTCNNVGSMEVGFNVVGEMRPFAMSGNRFNSHKVGLVVNDATVIGVQTLRGNKWQGPFTRLGAENLNSNSADIALSRFFVGSPNAPILPTYYPAASGWFQPIGGTDTTCASLNACPNGNPAGRVAAASPSNDASFYASAISEERMQTPNAEEMKWTNQRNAYGRLMDNPSHQDSRDKTNFMARMRNVGMGQLYQIEKGMKDVQNIGQEYNDVLMANANTVRALANEIADLDVKIFEAKESDKKAFMAQKKEKNATIYRLSTENAPRHATIERNRNVEIQRLMRDNERISARLQPEINERDVNAVYLATVAQGKMTLSNEQKAAIKLIAFQCPSKGGNAVFAARSLYSLVENVNFNDLELCGGHSQPVQGLVTKRVETTFKVSPNPATDLLTLNQPSEKTEAGEWLIFDTAGKLLLSKKVNENEIESNVNIQKLSEGVYFVSFSVNGQKRFTQKLVKIKSN